MPAIPANRNIQSLIAVAALFSPLFLSLSASAEWPEFRGPTRDGMVPPPPEGGLRGLPLEWGEKKNVKWKTPIPHRGWSTPVVSNNQIWLTTATEDGHEMYVVCVERDTGKVALFRKLYDVSHPEPLGNEVNCYASPSPVIEDGRVYVHFGSYGTACLDAETGATIWERRDFPCRHFRGPGSSPFLYQDKLILTFDGIDVQYLVALNKRTGETIWKTDRTTEWNDLDEHGKPTADGDLRKAYTTPIMINLGGRDALISCGAKTAFAYDPEDGSEIWKVRYEGYSNASRPIFGRGLVFLNTGYNNADLLAVNPKGEGDITESHVLWTQSKGMPRRSSPVLVDDLIYLANDGGIATCLDVKTGEEVWKERLGGQYSASALFADGRVHFFSEEGKTTILEPGRTFKVLAENKLDDGFMASAAVAGREFYLRTKKNLYRIEERGR